jgi:NAD(P)-dependent dehydrogenase (short-subunit alcohol dehydrogenase family)
MPTALMTGGGKRIGRALATALAASGYDIALHYHTSHADAEATAATLRAMGRKCWLFAADLGVMPEAAGLMDRVIATTGRVDVLVHNAAPFVQDRLATFTPESWQLHRAVILDAALYLMQTFARQEFAAGAGLIVTLLDSKLLHPTPEFLSYTLAKAGLAILTHLMAQELAPRIRVNGIAPGPTLPAPTQRQSHFEAMRAAAPLKTGASPEDLCRVLQLFLDTPSMTGQIIAVDGGASLP